MRMILASTSPRRHDLLSLLNVPFDIVSPTYVERLSSHYSPIDQARIFAEGKAQSCPQDLPNDLILACDTLIELDSQVLGKPLDRQDATRMLQRLSGRSHWIHTAVALMVTVTGKLYSKVDSVRVWFKPLHLSTVESYVATGESLGKAGAYGIQGRGADLIERIEGDYTAAVGLPLKTVARLLTDHGVTVPVDLHDLYRRNPYPNWARFAAPPTADCK